MPGNGVNNPQLIPPGGINLPILTPERGGSTPGDFPNPMDTLTTIGSFGAHAFEFGADFIPGIISIKQGFNITYENGNYYVRGIDQLNNPYLDRLYRNYTGLQPHQTWVSQDILSHPHYNQFNSHLQSHSIRNQVSNALGNQFGAGNRSFYSLSNNLRGGGPLGIVLDTGSSVYEFTQGGRADDGLLSSGFVSSVITDVGISAATTAGAALAGAAAGAAAGSVVPGIGTAVGFGVGLMCTVILNTQWGRNLRNNIQQSLETGIDKVVEGARNFTNWARGLFGSG